MKKTNSKINQFIIALCIATVSLMSCQKDSEVANENINLNEEENINNLLAEFRNSLDKKAAKSFSDGDIMINYKFEIVKNIRNNTYFIVKLEETPLFPVLHSEKEMKALSSGGYVVTCTKNGVSTSSNCSSGMSCAKLAAACIKDGGCAEVCKAPERLILDRDPGNRIPVLGLVDNKGEVTMSESKKNAESIGKKLDIQPGDEFNSVAMELTLVK